jgi:hypothetical protein
VQQVPNLSELDQHPPSNLFHASVAQPGGEIEEMEALEAAVYQLVLSQSLEGGCARFDKSLALLAPL